MSTGSEERRKTRLEPRLKFRTRKYQLTRKEEQVAKKLESFHAASQEQQHF